MKTVAIMTAALIGWPMATLAQTTTPGDLAGAQPAPPRGGSDIVCRSEDTIGTRLGGHRVCHTKLEWTQIQRDHRDRVENAQALNNTGRTQ